MQRLYAKLLLFFIRPALCEQQRQQSAEALRTVLRKLDGEMELRFQDVITDSSGFCALSPENLSALRDLDTAAEIVRRWMRSGESR